ncbi:hypothetical protein IC220_01595 [Wolbachia endosymbiont of Pentalonia nigronervosa]|uniref:hypothetical protein n=1 Tax=Wolbachia endosymbiont of Pentalonia nigronervosa TaxID=1301914 RepID=UPI00165F56D7|nr:hypothetical protein [Wolbachia endosymbiont of Pentalonia nigronervosa]MBD0391154.1 hypothetical protein [Wolbachia endosymbiont of Pentalonia nigronervosa]
MAAPGAVIGLVGGTAVGLVAPQTAQILDIDGDDNDLTYAEGLIGCAVGGTIVGAGGGFAVGYHTTGYAIGGVAAAVCAVGGAIPTTIRVGNDLVKGLSNKTKIKKLEHKIEKLEGFISWKEEQYILMSQTERAGPSKTKEVNPNKTEVKQRDSSLSALSIEPVNSQNVSI